jgi:hypothetical protein
MKKIDSLLLPAMALALVLAGCNKNQSQPQDQSQTQSAAADDPASANLAPASDTTAAPQENPPAPPADQAGDDQAPPPDQEQYGQDYSETADDAAPEPPPAIPDYDQPPAPGDNYQWTPGYWGYASEGYYWVPGAWVMAPFVGALWTPGYWGWDNNRYDWHHGYWGSHVGFYGGVNYGFGYDGNGYEGGYWRNNQFYYNRDVAHVSSQVHNVYDYRVAHPFNDSRVAYNGGHGGLNYRPTREQEAAQQERHFAPLPAQHALAQTAQRNRAQFAGQNHGKPQMVAESRPISTGAAPAARAEDFHGAPAIRAAPLNVPRPTPGRPAVHNEPRPESRPSTPAITRPENRNVPAPHGRPATRPEPRNQPTRPPAQAEPRQKPPTEARPQTRARPETHTEAKPQSRPETRPAPEHKQEARPKPHTEKKPDDSHPQG